MREEFAAMRTEMRTELGALRADFNVFQRQMITIGYALVGVMGSSMVALVIAVGA